MTPVGVVEPNGVLVVGVSPVPGLVVVGVPVTGTVPLFTGLQQQVTKNQMNPTLGEIEITKRFGFINKVMVCFG